MILPKNPVTIVTGTRPRTFPDTSSLLSLLDEVIGISSGHSSLSSSDIAHRVLVLMGTTSDRPFETTVYLSRKTVGPRLRMTFCRFNILPLVFPTVKPEEQHHCFCKCS